VLEAVKVLKLKFQKGNIVRFTWPYIISMTFFLQDSLYVNFNTFKVSIKVSLQLNK